MKLLARTPILLTLSAALCWGAGSRVTSVEPQLAQPGDAAVAKGESIGAGQVVKLFLTTGANDIEVEISEQNAESIGFSIPEDIELGMYRLMIQTGGAAPALMEQPVTVEVLTAEEIEQRRKELEELSRLPEPEPEQPPAEVPPQ